QLPWWYSNMTPPFLSQLTRCLFIFVPLHVVPKILCLLVTSSFGSYESKYKKL
ncbi:hypothetical protein S245_016153, partial [Arachis hypogaea]